MATRRQFCQAMVIVPVVGLLPEVAEARWPVKVTMIVVPEGDPAQCAEGFRVACTDWQKEHPRLRPLGSVFFWPYAEGGEPWLVHPSWAELPPAQNPTVLMADAREAFRRSAIIDRAVDLRLHCYWRAENPPGDYSTMTQAEFSSKWARARAWRKLMRAQLAYVGVTFNAVKA